MSINPLSASFTVDSGVHCRVLGIELTIPLRTFLTSLSLDNTSSRFIAIPFGSDCEYTYGLTATFLRSAFYSFWESSYERLLNTLAAQLPREGVVQLRLLVCGEQNSAMLYSCLEAEADPLIKGQMVRLCV
jgi:hypothetical protein